MARIAFKNCRQFLRISLVMLSLFSLPLTADSPTKEELHKKVQELQHEKEELHKKTQDLQQEKERFVRLLLEKQHLHEEKRRTHETLTTQHTEETKALLAHLRDQLTPHGLYFTFGGEDGNTLTISPLPKGEKEVRQQAHYFADRIKAYHTQLQAKQIDLANLQNQYGLVTTPEGKTLLFDQLTRTLREKHSLELALETAQAAYLRLEHLIKIQTKVPPQSTLPT